MIVSSDTVEMTLILASASFVMDLIIFLLLLALVVCVVVNDAFSQIPTRPSSVTANTEGSVLEKSICATLVSSVNAVRLLELVLVD
jgi:hypothetical protein